MQLSRLPSPAAGRDLSVMTAVARVPMCDGRVPAFVSRLSVRQTPSRSVGRSLFLSRPPRRIPKPPTPNQMLEPFGPLLLRTKSLRRLMPCLGMGSHFTTTMIIDSNSGSNTTSSSLNHDSDDDRAAPVFVERRYRLRVGLAHREAFHCRWRWCFVGDGAVWMGVYFALLGMEGEKQAPLLATTNKH